MGRAAFFTLFLNDCQMPQKAAGATKYVYERLVDWLSYYLFFGDAHRLDFWDNHFLSDGSILFSNSKIRLFDSIEISSILCVVLFILANFKLGL